MIKWLLLTFLFSINAYAESFTKGHGYFWAHDTDRHEFIKKQLIHEGYKSIISKELSKMDLNKDIFWKKFEEKLEEKYVIIEEDLKKKLKITEESSRKEKSDFKKSLRIKKLNYRVKFGRIYTAISRYSIKKLSRSSKNPNSRSISMEANVNPKILSKIYYKYVSGQKKSEYGSLYLNIHYNLEDITYTELGVENESEFSNVISKKWIDWFAKNKPVNIANVEELTVDNKKKYLEYQKLPTELMLTSIPEIFVNSLLLDIEIKIKRVKFNKIRNEYEFEYSGAGYLKELQTNIVVENYQFDSELKKYQAYKDINIANIIVNHVYRMALGSFPKIVASLKNITNISSIQKLEISDFNNMKQVFTLVERIQNKGIKYSLKSQIDSIGKNNVNLYVYYYGKVEELKGLLNSINIEKKEQLFTLVDTDNAIGIKFNKINKDQVKQDT